MHLTAHPRLYVSAEALEALPRPLPAGAPAFLRAAQKIVAKEAEEYVRSARFHWELRTHNAHLVRARINQRRVLTLLTRWKQTGQRRYRDMAMAHIAEMGRWKLWSWVAWRANSTRPDAIFDLSYGENAATLAVAYDWMYASLTAAEQKTFCAIVKRWVFDPYLNLKKPLHKDWWFQKPDTNWNTVCAGGAGLCALAFAEEFPRESATTLKRTEASIKTYFKYLDQSRGGWPEGIGYWGYGMRYGWMYVLAWERATGKKHPLLKSPNVQRTLEFPLDFLPNGEPCSFGDVNRYWMLPFHFGAARRFGRDDLIHTLDGLITRKPDASPAHKGEWPNAAELLLFRREGAAGRQPPPQRPYAKVYLGQDWFILADHWPDPALYLSIRGGTTQVPHGHIDLTSFHCVVGDESMLTTISASEYLDTTFSPRRFELPEFLPPLKNMLLLNGLGIVKPSQVATQLTRAAGFPAVHIEATDALNGAPNGFRMAESYQRLFVLLGSRGAVVIDRVQLPAPHTGRAEVRLQTPAGLAATPARATAVISGRRHKLGVACAATVPGLMRTAVPALTSPPPGLEDIRRGKSAPELRTLRWGSQKLHDRMVFATLLTPGGKPGRVAVTEDRRGDLTMAIGIGSFRKTLRFDRKLRGKK